MPRTDSGFPDAGEFSSEDWKTSGRERTPPSVPGQRPSSLEEKIAFLEGEVECMQFLLALLFARGVGKRYAGLVAKAINSVPLSEEDSMYQKGYSNAFQRLRQELMEID